MQPSTQREGGIGTLEKHEEAICARVRQERERLGLSQAQVAEYLGLSPAGYGHYDRGTQPFTIEQVFRLAPLLGRSVAWILGLPTALSEEEDRLLTLFRAISDDQVRRFVLDILEHAPKS